MRIIVKDVAGKVIEEWIDGDGDDGFDADWCINHQTLGIDLPNDIIAALVEARDNERSKKGESS